MESIHHIPVLLEEVLAALNPRPGGRYADGTIGCGGHAEAILERSSPDGRLFGCDRDADALDSATGRLARFKGRWELREGRFSELADWVEPGSCDGVLLDLGVSSPQLDRAERGFSFQQDGPLDMRMNRNQPLTAAEIVNEWPAEDLARIFRDLGEEREARRLARAIERARLRSRFETTRQLAQLIENAVPRGQGRNHPATRVFQGLRMKVNDELGTLSPGLEAAWKLLRPTGRLAVISFHSLEHRAVKKFGNDRARSYTVPGEIDVPELREPSEPTLKWFHRKALTAGRDEIDRNPRARSAQLRVMERI